MPGLSVEAQQRLECDPESWECRWAEQVRLLTENHSVALMTDIMAIIDLGCLQRWAA